MRLASSQMGTPSFRQWQPNAQRGSGSPGYHFPCPKLVGGDGEGGVHLQTAREGLQKLPRVLSRVTVIFAVLGDEAGVLPDGHAILPPMATECPARQWLAGIPLPLSEMRQAAGREALAQPAQQFHGMLAFHRPQRGGGPLSSVVVVERNESRLAPPD